MNKKQENFLDYIPKHNSLYEWQKNEDGIVEVKVVNKGFYHFIAQKLFKRPKISYIALEGMGTFIWEQIDGKKTVYEIGQCVKQEYHEEAEPLYERLCTYIKSLHNLCFVVYENKK